MYFAVFYNIIDMWHKRTLFNVTSSVCRDCRFHSASTLSDWCHDTFQAVVCYIGSDIVYMCFDIVLVRYVIFQIDRFFIRWLTHIDAKFNCALKIMYPCMLIGTVCVFQVFKSKSPYCLELLEPYKNLL